MARLIKYGEDNLTLWENKKLREWRKMGKLKSDGTLKVGKQFAKKKRGRPRKFLVELSIAEICAILR